MGLEASAVGTTMATRGGRSTPWRRGLREKCCRPIAGGWGPSLQANAIPCGLVAPIDVAQAHWRVAVVIPTANQAREPARTSIERARKSVAAMGATIHVVESSGPGFRFSRSVNRGIREAPDADAWVLLNDDCFMDDGWLEAMVDAARSHPEAGLVGAVLRYPSGRIQHAGGRLMDPFRYLAYSLRKRAPFWGLRAFRNSVFRDTPYFGHYTRVDPRHRLDLLTGACLLITRRLWDRIGGFDEGYEFSFEDVDYCLRALEAGFELALAVDARGVHLERATGGGLKEASRRSEDFFRTRWGSRSKVKTLVSRGGRKGIHHGRGPLASCGCTRARAVPMAS
jgi:hypothetical protein